MKFNDIKKDGNLFQCFVAWTEAAVPVTETHFCCCKREREEEEEEEEKEKKKKNWVNMRKKEKEGNIMEGEKTTTREND